MSPVKQRRNLRKLIKERKNRPCQDCKVQHRLDLMTYDHVRGIKLFNLGDNVHYHTEAEILDEIAKCEVVCLSCHRARESHRLLEYVPGK